MKPPTLVKNSFPLAAYLIVQHYLNMSFCSARQPASYLKDIPN